MTNKIIVLGAGEGQLPLIIRAKKEGWYTIVVSPKGNYPGFLYADKCYYENISDYNAVLQIAIAEQIDAIATDQTDISVPVVYNVAKKMCLPHIECIDIQNFQLKSNMRDVCMNVGIPTIPYKVVNTLYDAKLFLLSIAPNSAIIKPIDSQGSRGVQRVFTVEELCNNWEDTFAYTRSNKVIIEQYIEGQEIEVDTVIQNGKIVDVLIGDVYNFEQGNAYSAYERVYPSVLDNDKIRKIKEVNSSTIDALGMITGWLHGEYIVSKDGNVYLLEVGARGGGNYIGSDIVRTMLGVSTDEMAFQTAIGNSDFFSRVKLKNVFCAYKCFFLPEGVVKKLNINNSLLNESFIVRHNLNTLKEGLAIYPNKDKTSRYTIVLSADSRQGLRNIMNYVQQNIQVDVMTFDGIRHCIWK